MWARADTVIGLSCLAFATIPSGCRCGLELALPAPSGWELAVAAVVDEEGVVLSHTDVFAVLDGPPDELTATAHRSTDMRVLFFGYAAESLATAGCPGAGCEVTLNLANPELPVPDGVMLTPPFSRRPRPEPAFAPPADPEEEGLATLVRLRLRLQAGAGVDGSTDTGRDAGTDGRTDSGSMSRCGSFAGELWCDSFETGTLEFPPWATVVANGTSALWGVDDTLPMHGNWALSMSSALTGDSVQVHADIPTAGITSGTLAFRGYLRRPPAPVVSSELWLWRVKDLSAGAMTNGFTLVLFDSAGGDNIWLFDDFASVFEGSSMTFPTGSYQCLEIIIDLATDNSGSIEVRLNGVPVLSRTMARTVTSNGFNEMRIEIHATETDVLQEVRWDELVWATSPIGCD